MPDIFTLSPKLTCMVRGFMLAVVLFLTNRGLTQKTLIAYKTAIAPVIDGRLEDAVWQDAPVATDFVQYTPDFGKSSSSKSTVKILYDDDAIYIGAYLYDDPELIRKQLTIRDGELQQDADFFSVFFDTYHDKQNGFQFLVTPANVQTDSKLTASANFDLADFGDRTWDAVWQSKTSIAADGWIVEMRIPYLSLRFPKKDLQTWGLQFLRYSRRKNELDFWNLVNPNENGFINQFGLFTELRDVKPPLRLSLSPYLSGGLRHYPEGFGKDKEVLYNGGMDIKYGINESFTLDATLIPDYGQTVSDNIVNNLSPFEQQFQENRPFFTEGTELFEKSGLFYSRRIGAIPAGYSAVLNLQGYTPIKNPSVTQLYNAIKLSGRTKGKLGIGVFNAVTAPMYATVKSNFSGIDSSFETEPLTNYNLFVLDQALKGRSSITFTNANVIRSGEVRDANASALDFSYFTPNNKYQFKLSGRYSKIFGYTSLPDLDYSSYGINLIEDTVRLHNELMVKPYDGFRGGLFLGKVSGKVQYSFTSSVISSKYDPNDLGYLQAPNEVIYDAVASYNQLTATDNFINYRYTIGTRLTNMYKPAAYNQYEVYGKASWTFKNFWGLSLFVGSQPFASHDYFEMRTPNRYLQKPAFHYITAIGNTDNRKQFYFNYSIGYSHAEVKDGNYYLTDLDTRYRFSDRLTLSLDFTREDEQNQIGYAFWRESNGEPVVGYRRNIQTTTILNSVYSFAPRLNLSLRTRHYWNRVHYKDFFHVDQNGQLALRSFIAGRDENYNLFNVDAFLTWDFRLGSRIIIGYKNWLGDPYGVRSQIHYFNNLTNLFNTSHGNELTVKLIYFLDYNQLRKKH